MNRPATPTPAGPRVLPVWRGRRGDGPVRCFPAGAATPTQVEEAVEGAVRRLVDRVGPLRAGNVEVYRFGPGSKFGGPADGVAFAQAVGVELEPALIDFLRAEPLGTLVLAMCPTDRISRRTPPRGKGRRR